MNNLYFASTMSLVVFIMPSIILWSTIITRSGYGIPMSMTEVNSFYKSTIFLATLSALWLGFHFTLVILWIMEIIPPPTVPGFVLLIAWGCVVGVYMLVWLENRKSISRSIAIIHKRHGQNIELKDYLQFIGKTIPPTIKEKVAILADLTQRLAGAHIIYQDAMLEVSTQLAHIIHTQMSEAIASLQEGTSENGPIAAYLFAFFRVEYPAGIAERFNKERFEMFNKYLECLRTQAHEPEPKMELEEMELEEFVSNMLNSGTKEQRKVALEYYAMLRMKGLLGAPE